MAYIFPVNPFDGQLYPVPAQPGALQYQWNGELKVWLIYSPLGVQSVTGLLPIVVTGGTDNAVVKIEPATVNTAGSMSAADKAKLDNLPEDAGTGTVTLIETGAGLGGGPITTTGLIEVVPASATVLGGVSIGDNIVVTPDGKISVPTGSFGVTSINVGPGLVGNPAPITGTGTISAALATRATVGAVRVGNGLNVTTDGTISLGGTLGDITAVAWGSISVAGPAPYRFTVKEGYNISAITWLADDQPRVRVFFQNILANADFGVSLTGRVSTYGGSASNQQDNVVLNFSFKSTTYIDLLCASLTTINNTTTNLTMKWNDWSSLTEFDIIIVDTAIYP
jgi:hypothetical protein